MKAIIVCGPWGGGTSAVAGLVARLGAVAPGPTFRTSDPRTPDTHESAAFRDLLLSLADEPSFRLRVPRAAARTALQAFRDRLAAEPALAGATVVLKHALDALVVPELCELFDARVVFVLRPLADIEATRLRRGWPAFVGAEGARRVHAAMFEALVEHPLPVTLVRYPELLARPAPVVASLAQFGRLSPTPAQLAEAEAFVARRGGS